MYNWPGSVLGLVDKSMLFLAWSVEDVSASGGSSGSSSYSPPCAILQLVGCVCEDIGGRCGGAEFDAVGTKRQSRGRNVFAIHPKSDCVHKLVAKQHCFRIQRIYKLAIYPTFFTLMQALLNGLVGVSTDALAVRTRVRCRYSRARLCDAWDARARFALDTPNHHTPFLRVRPSLMSSKACCCKSFAK